MLAQYFRSLNRVMLGLLALSLMPASPGWASENAVERDKAQACVVLLHGLWRSAWSMKAVEWELSSAGYQVVNSSYPSESFPIKELATMAVSGGVDACREQGFNRIHFVTHSLGGILVRAYLSQRQIPELHRVVMLGPPNQGSQFADYVGTLTLLRPLAPGLIDQLGTGEQSVPLQLGPVNFQLGIIAGTANYRGFLPGVPDEPGDGTVTVAETYVPGMQDILKLPVSHSFMMWDDSVLQQVVYFLRNGVFKRESPMPEMP